MVTKKQVLDKLRTVQDPEIAVSIVDLGLIYDVKVDKGTVHIKMTFTTPACPLLQHIISQVEAKVKELKNVKEVKIEVVWDPPWTPEKMSDKAKAALGII